MKESVKTIRVSEHIRLDTRPTVQSGRRGLNWRVDLGTGFSTKAESVVRVSELAMKFFYTSETASKTTCHKAHPNFAELQSLLETACIRN